VEVRYDTYCGLYCGACDTMLANENGTVTSLARSWKREPEDLICYGCKSSRVAKWCEKCGIRVCAIEKHVENCGDCTDFPCPRLQQFATDRSPHHHAVIENSKEAKRTGIQGWLEQQRVRWTCPQCGTRFSWYKRKCATCGARLADCRTRRTGQSKV